MKRKSSNIYYPTIPRREFRFVITVLDARMTQQFKKSVNINNGVNL